MILIRKIVLNVFIYAPAFQECALIRNFIESNMHGILAIGGERFDWIQF